MGIVNITSAALQASFITFKKKKTKKTKYKKIPVLENTAHRVSCLGGDLSFLSTACYTCSQITVT